MNLHITHGVAPTEIGSDFVDIIVNSHSEPASSNLRAMQGGSRMIVVSSQVERLNGKGIAERATQSVSA